MINLYIVAISNKIVERNVLKIYHSPMDKKGMALIEIVVSMLVLSAAALAVTATVSMVTNPQMRSAGGSSLDLQALSYARQTLELLKNNVSTDATGRGAPLVTPINVNSGLPAGFTRTYTVSDAGFSGSGLKKATVCVAWSPDSCP
jgi:Tfp pilus assembly protein PilV